MNREYVKCDGCGKFVEKEWVQGVGLHTPMVSFSMVGDGSFEDTFTYTICGQCATILHSGMTKHGLLDMPGLRDE